MMISIGDTTIYNVTVLQKDYTNHSTVIYIYPNPAQDQIIINHGERTDMHYTIYDSLGRIALTKSILESHHNMVWDISKLSTGIYFLSISHQGKLLKSVKVVVE